MLHTSRNLGNAILLAAILVCIAVEAFGQDEILSGLDIKTVSLCRTVAQSITTPCVVLTDPNASNVIYLAVFNIEGTEMVEIVRQDFTTGKEEVVWRKGEVRVPPKTPQYPQKKGGGQ